MNNKPAYQPSVSIIDYKRLSIRYESVIDEQLGQHIRKLSHYLIDYYEKQDQEVEVFHTYAEIAVQFLDHPPSIREEADQLEEILASVHLSDNVSAGKENAKVKIPVCYEQPFAKDVAEVAQINQLSEKEVIDRHHAPVYQVYFIGFLPGFPYLGGLDKRICAPRKEKARSRIQKGDVGIAGCQTGIYPVESPGGWQIIGNSPIDLLQLSDEMEPLLKSGDRLSFYPISKEEHQAIKNQDKEIDLT